MTVRVIVQTLVAADKYRLPNKPKLSRWVAQTVQGKVNKAEMTIRIVDETESAQLNSTYRRKNGPTNVLSFPFEADVPLPVRILGDVVICAPVVEREAQTQHKIIESHWAHMVIHGTLHLLGYDHQTEAQAQQMEGLEIQLMQQLGYANPYEARMPS